MVTRIIADVLIPGRGSPIEDGSVIHDGGVITFAGHTADAPPAASDESTFEVAAVLPGLWDCHAHFTGLERPYVPDAITGNRVAAAARAVGDLGRVLDAGVTSVREVGGLGLDIAPAINAGAVEGPTVYGAGGVLSTTGGHADAHELPLDWVHGADSMFGGSRICDGVPEVLRAVRLNLRKNARVIKVCASGGVMSEVDHPIHQQFSDEELRAIVEEAARAERVVAAHCHGKPGIMAALKAGVHTIEHGSYLDEEAADLMVEKGAMLVPTRFVINELLGQADILPKYAYEKGLMVSEHHESAMKIAIAKGVKIAAGCDIFLTGDANGRNSAEVSNLINAGLTDLEAIESATALAAETLGPQAPPSGVLAAGHDADVIAFDTNPLDDRSVWGDSGRVTHVWKRGSLEKNAERG